MSKKSLSILFAGEPATAVLNDGTTVAVFVRALPERYLCHVMEVCEWKSPFIELCTYLKLDPEAPADAEPLAVAFPDVLPPTGYQSVPKGWADNLSDASIKELSATAERLNFQRAATWAQGQIAAKKLVAPLHEAAMAQVMPLVDHVLQPLLKKLDALSSSMRSAPSSWDAPGSSS